MSDDTWFRNSKWDTEIAARFEEKLRRARRKEQYLRIQACCLRISHPEVALELLDRFFQLPDQFDQAQARVDQATALLALGRVEEAITAYELALSREAEFPNLKTSAYIALPSLIVERELSAYYGRALEILRGHVHRPVFPSEQFQWHATQAVILQSRGYMEEARHHARAALEAAATKRSGFRYHPRVGLVNERHGGILRRLENLCDA